MVNLLKNLKFRKRKNIPTQKLLITFTVLFLYRFCNTIPLEGIDQIALKQAFSQLGGNNAILQILNMYSGGGGNTLLSPFSLGIIPFINASILVDLLATVFPSLEKLQSEEGEIGRQTILYYKKIITLFFSIAQSLFLLFSLKSYIYNTSFLNLGMITIQLTAGAFVLIWFTNFIDNKGVGNGTSLLIVTNIIVSFLHRESNFPNQIDENFLFEIIFLFFFIGLICLSQTARITLKVVSARQLAFLEKLELEKAPGKISKGVEPTENGLSIRFNQAGIFPIIIASNLFPFFSFFFNSFGNKGIANNITTIFYYLSIILFNYLYTSVFWDPQKIAEKLRKSSVSIKNVTPGSETISYLENTVRASSILGGFFLCFILFSFEIIKSLTNGILLNQINISSLIIVVGVAYETQLTIRSLYKIHQI